MSTPAEVRKLDFAGDFPNPPYTNQALSNVLSVAALLVDETAFNTNKERYDKAVAAFAAHLAFKLKQGGDAATGPVTAEAAGGLSRSYGSLMSGENDKDLLTTPYGVLFIQLRDAVPSIVPLVLC